MEEVNVAEQSAKGDLNQGSVYSVVFTTIDESTTFEIYVLKGSAKAPKEVSEDVQKAKDWLDKLERF